MQRRPVSRPGLGAVLRWLYLVAVAVAAVLAIRNRSDVLSEALAVAELDLLVASSIAALAGVGLSGLIWRRLLGALGSPLPLRPAAGVFFVAQVGKYLPGSVWPVLAQAQLGRAHGVPRRSAVAAQVLFMWVHLVTGAVLGLPVFAAFEVVPFELIWLTPLLVALLAPRLAVGLIDLILTKVGRQPLPGRISGRDMAVACGWALAMWICYGLSVYLAIDAIEFTAPALEIVVSIGVFGGAWAFGFLLLIAPAGAGVREVALVAGLSTIAAPDTAFTVALISRLVLTVADVAWAVGAGLAGGIRRGSVETGVAPPPTG